MITAVVSTVLVLASGLCIGKIIVLCSIFVSDLVVAPN